LFGYVNGQWPPGVKGDLARASRVVRNLLEGHARAARVLHAQLPKAQVGLAHHVLLIQPASSSPLDETIAGLTDDWANTAIARAAQTGRVKLYVPGVVDLDEEVEGLKGSFDYFGMNQYYRAHLRADLGVASLSQLYTPSDKDISELGGEIYPESL